MKIDFKLVFGSVFLACSSSPEPKPIIPSVYIQLAPVIERNETIRQLNAEEMVRDIIEMVKWKEQQNETYSKAISFDQGYNFFYYIKLCDTNKPEPENSGNNYLTISLGINDATIRITDFPPYGSADVFSVRLRYFGEGVNPDDYSISKVEGIYPASQEAQQLYEAMLPYMYEYFSVKPVQKRNDSDLKIGHRYEKLVSSLKKEQTLSLEQAEEQFPCKEVEF